MIVSYTDKRNMTNACFMTVIVAPGEAVRWPMNRERISENLSRFVTIADVDLFQGIESRFPAGEFHLIRTRHNNCSTQEATVLLSPSTAPLHIPNHKQSTSKALKPLSPDVHGTHSICNGSELATQFERTLEPPRVPEDFT